MPSSLQKKDKSPHTSIALVGYDSSESFIAPEDFNSLLNTLENGTEEEFLQQYRSSKFSKCVDKHHILLLKEVTKQAQKTIAFDAIFLNIKEINSSHEEDVAVDIVTVACIAGNFVALKKILDRKDFKFSQNQIHLKINDVVSRNSEHEFWKCFDTLLDSTQIDVNAIRINGLSALQFALLGGYNVAVEKILKAGAFLGYESSHDDKALTINGIDPQLLKELFDSCVTSNGCNPSDENFEIIFNYKNFIPPKKIGFEKLLSETQPILGIATSKTSQHLLNHPLIASFLSIKWQGIAMLYYTKFVFYCWYTLTMAAYIVLKCGNCDCQNVMYFLKLLSVYAILSLVFREILMFCLGWKQYISKPSTYFEVLLICLSIKMIMMDTLRHEIIVVIMILCMAGELCIVVGYLPIFSFSTHMLMLIEVFKSFLKSIALYSIFIFTFGLCFYVLIGGEDSNNNARNATNVGNDTIINKNTDEDKSIDMFSNVFKSFVKVMAMFSGELDLQNLALKSTYGYILFLLFVICMPIVLLNLLNGLAVSDIQVVRAKAELSELICRTKLLNEFGDVTAFLNVFSQCICRSSIRIHLNGRLSNHINSSNNCEVCSRNESIKKTIIGRWLERSSVMESRIVKSAMDVIAQQKSKNNQTNQLKNVMENIEEQQNWLQNIGENVKKQNNLLVCIETNIEKHENLLQNNLENFEKQSIKLKSIDETIQEIGENVKKIHKMIERVK